ncbi:MAG: UTP--glucose-1-phosphate uridylyltransferase [Candidatus Cloacimonetes bacterium]|nr:UTP--glucose-1-phosphate uridylyltransferase [Candidatus Cloacimonadota bacterium]
MDNHLTEFVELMQKEGLDDLVIQSFSNAYYRILEGATGILSEADIEPPSQEHIIDYYNFAQIKSSPLEKLVVIKLNGGLGTSMGLEKAKTLLQVKNGLNFLDIITQQILELRKVSGKNIPLLFMHSFNTRQDSLDHLKQYGDLPLPHLPLDFVQNKLPKIIQKDLTPLQNEDAHKNWNPPGHGEIYSVLSSSGILDKLLDQGFEYAFISNSDNLGAVVDEKILSYFSDHKIPFLMEVCLRTGMDRKGGHLAQTKKGQLILRESAQCPEDETELFQDIERYGYFNTNNLWINLKALKQKLFDTNNLLPLQLILNSKVVDGVKVYQVESAMGSAISIFKGSKAVVVDRDRFAPVKKTNDLLALWSDAYKLTSAHKLELISELVPNIDLQDEYYKNIADFSKRFAEGVPSLKKCTDLRIASDVFFGKNVKIIGNVTISKDATLKNCTLQNEEMK